MQAALHDAPRYESSTQYSVKPRDFSKSQHLNMATLFLIYKNALNMSFSMQNFFYLVIFLRNTSSVRSRLLSNRIQHAIFTQYVLSVLIRTAACLGHLVSCQQNTTQRDTPHPQYIIAYLQNTFSILLSSATCVGHTVSWQSKRPTMLRPVLCKTSLNLQLFPCNTSSQSYIANKTPHYVITCTLSMTFRFCKNTFSVFFS